MRFNIFYNKIALVTYWRPHGIIFASPPPEVLEKKWAVYVLYFYVHFPSVFVEFVVLVTKIW